MPAVLIFSCGQNPNPSSDTQNANAFIGKENCKKSLRNKLITYKDLESINNNFIKNQNPYS